MQCCFLVLRSDLIGYGKHWLGQCPDNLTEWDIRSWCQRADFQMGQYYEVAMGARCQKSVPVQIYITFGVERA